MFLNDAVTVGFYFLISQHILSVFEILFGHIHENNYELSTHFLDFNIELLQICFSGTLYDEKCFKSYVKLLCEALIHSNSMYNCDLVKAKKYIIKKVVAIFLYDVYSERTMRRVHDKCCKRCFYNRL